MGQNSVISGHPKFTRISRVDGLSTGPPNLGCHTMFLKKLFSKNNGKLFFVFSHCFLLENLKNNFEKTVIKICFFKIVFKNNKQTCIIFSLHLFV